MSARRNVFAVPVLGSRLAVAMASRWTSIRMSGSAKVSSSHVRSRVIGIIRIVKASFLFCIPVSALAQQPPDGPLYPTSRKYSYFRQRLGAALPQVKGGGSPDGTRNRLAHAGVTERPRARHPCRRHTT